MTNNAAQPAGPEPYFNYLQRARAELDTRPDPQAAMQMLRVLAEQYLGQPAAELLAAPVLQQAAPDELRAAVAQLPRGTVSWIEQAETRAANLDAVRTRWPELAERAAACDPAARGLELLRTRGGDWLLTRRVNDAPRHWLRNLTIAQRPQLPPRGELGPVALLGTRDAPLVESIRAATAQLFLTYSHPLFVLEPDLATFVAWLHLADHRELLGDPRVHLLVGGDAADQLQALLAARPALQAPTAVINLGLGRETADRVHNAVQAAETSRQTRLEACLAEIESRYADRDHDYWAARYQQPRRLLAITSRYTTMLQHSVRDAVAAFEDHGWETEVYLEDCDHERFSALVLGEKLLDFDPDLVLQLDHLRYEWPVWPANLPMLTWIQDPMPNLLCPQAGASLGPLDFVCGYFKQRCVAEFGYSAERFQSTVVPVSERLFHDRPSSPADAARYACDVAFVSNASDTIEQIHATYLEGNPPELHPVFEALFDRIGQLLADGVYLSPHEDADRFVREVVADVRPGLDPALVERIKNEYAYRIYDRGRRHETLTWAADWARRTGRTLRLYGRGWEQHPTLAPFAAGVLPHGEPLRAALHHANLALQLIPAGFRHQRTYETLAAGTLPLTRYCGTDYDGLPVSEFVALRKAGQPTRTPHAAAFPGLDRITFDAPGEFAELADRYLEDVPLRNATRDEFRRIVLARHTYRAVVGGLIEHVRGGMAGLGRVLTT